MDNERIKESDRDTCNEPPGDSIWSMARDFYSRKMLSVAILVWMWGTVFSAGAVYCAVRFFGADQMKSQILYAALFVCCFNGICLMKILGWQMIHRRGIKREVRRLNK